MKAKLVFALGGIVLGCLSLTDCGGGGAATSGFNSGSSASPSDPLGGPPSVLDTQQVLALAEKSSETAQPFAVDGGAVSVYPTEDETSEPISVDGT